MEETAIGAGPFRRALCLRQTMLGDGEQWVPEADVLLHRPDLYLLTLNDFPAAFARRTRAAGSRWARIDQRVELPELPGSRRFTEVNLTVAVDAREAVLLVAEPGRRDAPDPEDATARVDAGVRAVERPVDEIGPPPRPVPRDLAPRSIVTLWGEGSARIRWRFRPDGNGVRQGDALVRALLEVPDDVGEVYVLVSCSAVIEREWAGAVDTSEPRLPAVEVFREPLRDVTQ